MARKERKVPDFSPDDLANIEYIQDKVLKQPGSAPETAPVKRPMLPSYYNKGGMVKSGSPAHTAPCHDTKTISSKCY